MKLIALSLVMGGVLSTTQLPPERWSGADCTTQKAAQRRERPYGFTLDDPEFLRLYNRWFRLLTECAP
jgi:hypothetical protein